MISKCYKLEEITLTKKAWKKNLKLSLLFSTTREHKNEVTGLLSYNDHCLKSDCCRKWIEIKCMNNHFNLELVWYMTPYSRKSSFNFLKKKILVLTFKALIEKYDDNSMVSNNTQKNILNKNNDINGTVVPNVCGYITHNCQV